MKRKRKPYKRVITGWLIPRDDIEFDSYGKKRGKRVITVYNWVEGSKNERRVRVTIDEIQ